MPALLPSTQPSLSWFSASPKPLGYNQCIFSCLLTNKHKGGLNVKAFLRTELDSLRLCCHTLGCWSKWLLCPGPGVCPEADAACNPPNSWELSTSVRAVQHPRVILYWVFTVFHPTVNKGAHLQWRRGAGPHPKLMGTEQEPSTTRTSLGTISLLPNPLSSDS